MVDKLCQVCKHTQKNHFVDGENSVTTIAEYGEHWCSGCTNARTVPARNSFHTFKLDNLAYIEELAKERGLV